MVRRDTSNLDWDELLDGTLHTVNLAAIGFAGGINDLRALAYREADRRRCTVTTSKRSPLVLQIQATIGCACLVKDGPHLQGCRLYVTPRTAEQEARADANAAALAAGLTLEDLDPSFTPPAVPDPGGLAA